MDLIGWLTTVQFALNIYRTLFQIFQRIVNCLLLYFPSIIHRDEKFLIDARVGDFI